MGAREDDTTLDALAAHARAHPDLSAEAADHLIGAAGGGDRHARETLVEHSLGVVLNAAVARRDRGVEVIDLYQEGSMAAVIAVEEYVGRRGSGSQLSTYVRRVVEGHLDRVVAAEQAAAEAAARLIQDTRLLEAAALHLRDRAGRPPSETELAAALQWPAERVERIAGLLATARELFDADIVQYLDDSDGE
jgi:DNA-directed RNA polymerase specialized sigma subunit